jgi:hypothetical protein
VLLIPAPTDVEIYRCCRAIANLLRQHVSSERLWLEHDLPLSPGFCDADPPAAMRRVLARDSTLIARIQIDVGGLQIHYVRSGGHDPFRESFFDEVFVVAVEDLRLSDQQVQDVLITLYKRLGATAVRGTPLFSDLFETALQKAPVQRPIHPSQ